MLNVGEPRMIIEEKWSPRNLVVSRVGRVIPLHERGLGYLEVYDADGEILYDGPWKGKF